MDISVEPDRPPRRFSPTPWLLLIAAIGGGAWYWKAAVRPLESQLGDKTAAVDQLTRERDLARADADAAKKAAADNAGELEHAKADLAKAAAQRSSDEKLLLALKQQAAGAEVAGEGGAITLTMVDRILFKSGVADLTPQGEDLLRKVGAVLAPSDKTIEVGGHADNQPVESAIKERFPTNWELSAARATNVVRFLAEQVGIKPNRLKAAGYGSSRPIASNATEKGRARNRRIEILLLPGDVKVVKGDFSDEIAAAKPVPRLPSGPSKLGTVPPRPVATTPAAPAKAQATAQAKGKKAAPVAAARPTLAKLTKKSGKTKAAH